MYGYLFHRRIGVVTQILLLSALLLSVMTVSASPETVLIIKSSDNSFFNKTIEQLINQTRSQVKFQIETIDSLKQNTAIIQQASLVITLGLQAANSINDKSTDSPVIHSYLTEIQYLKHRKQSNHHSILLDQPLHRYISFIKHLLGTKKIALIKRKISQISNNNLDQLSSVLDVEIDQKLFESGDNPINLVRELLIKNDVLLSLPDPEIYNRKSLKGILLTSYRQNKPLISYSPAHVKSGALAAIFSSPEKIGNQIAELLNNFLEHKTFQAAKFYYAAEFEIKINQRVGKSLGLKLTDKKQLLRLINQEQGL